MEGRNINKKKRGRECGEDPRHVPAGKRSEMMSDSKTKLHYQQHDPLVCGESTDGLGLCYNNISGYKGNCDQLHGLIDPDGHENLEEKEKEKEKEITGVFDFPWLKEGGEGMIFEGEDELCLQGIMGMSSVLEEDTFALYSSCLPNTSSNSPCCTASTSISSSSPAFHHNPLVHDNVGLEQRTTPCQSIFHDDDHYLRIFDHDNSLSFGSLQVDHTADSSSDQPTDCIWSSVLDQPLDVNLNMI